MRIGRRGFLHTLAAAAVGAVGAEFDTERLLWVPGAKTFFLPSLETDAGAVTREFAALQEKPLAEVLREGAEQYWLNTVSGRISRGVVPPEGQRIERGPIPEWIDIDVDSGLIVF